MYQKNIIFLLSIITSANLFTSNNKPRLTKSLLAAACLAEQHNQRLSTNDDSSSWETYSSSSDNSNPKTTNPVFPRYQNLIDSLQSFIAEQYRSPLQQIHHTLLSDESGKDQTAWWQQYAHEVLDEIEVQDYHYLYSLNEYADPNDPRVIKLTQRNLKRKTYQINKELRTRYWQLHNQQK